MSRYVYARLEVDLTEELRKAAQAGARLALAERAEYSSPWLSVNSAADYLDTTQQAIRGLIKRRQIPFERTPTGRIVFDRQALDDWVTGGSRLPVPRAENGGAASSR